MPWRAATAATCAGSISTSAGRVGSAAGVDSASTKLANWWPVEVPSQRAGVDDVTT